MDIDEINNTKIRNSKKDEIIFDYDFEKNKIEICRLFKPSNKIKKIKILKSYINKNNKSLKLKKRFTNIPSDSISSGFSDLIVHDETNKNHIDTENGKINSPFQWSTVEEITPIDEKICCLNENNSENRNGHLLKEKVEKPCINPNINDALLNDEVNSTGTIKSNSFLKAGILKKKSRRMNDFCDNGSFNKTSHFLEQNNRSNKLNNKLLNSASNDDICSMIMYSESISLLRSIPNKEKLVNTVPEEEKTEVINEESSNQAVEEKNTQTYEIKKNAENLRMKLRCKKREYQILQKEKDKKTFGHYIGETYKGSLLDNLISEKLIRCNEIDIKTSKAWKSKPVYIRNANFFKDSLFFQLVEKNYINCLKTRGEFDEKKIGNEYKKRNYKFLQEILRKEKGKEFYKNGGNKCIGQCNNEVYTGSVLDKLIAKSLIRINMEYAEMLKSKNAAIERKKIKGEMEIIFPLILVEDYIIEDLNEDVFLEKDISLLVDKKPLITNSKHLMTESSGINVETNTLDSRIFMDEHFLTFDAFTVENFDRISLSEAQIDNDEVTISVESIDMQIHSENTDRENFETPGSNREK